MIRRILRFATFDVVVLLAVGSLAVLFSRRSRSGHIEPLAPRIVAPGPTASAASPAGFASPREPPSPPTAIEGDAPSGLTALFPPRTAPSAADPVPVKAALRLDWGDRDEPRSHERS